MYLYSVFASLGISSLIACSGFSGDDGSNKFSGGSAAKPSTEMTDGDNQAPTSTPGCSNGEKIQITHLAPEIQACLNAGYLYQFNKWSDNEGVHKDEFCIKTGLSLECSAESLSAKSQELLKRDKSAYIQSKFDEGYLPVSCATISDDRLIYQLVKRAESGDCSASSGASIVTICDRYYPSGYQSGGDKTQAEIRNEVNQCLDDPDGKTR